MFQEQFYISGFDYSSRTTNFHVLFFLKMFLSLTKLLDILFQYFLEVLILIIVIILFSCLFKGVLIYLITIFYVFLSIYQKMYYDFFSIALDYMSASRIEMIPYIFTIF